MYRTLTMLLLATSLYGTNFISSDVCRKCHPTIYNEYRDSMHSKSSIYSDDIHKGVWEHHPMKKDGKYKCAKCHTPSDTKLVNSLLKDGKGMPQDNEIEQKEPIGCTYCHRIKGIKEGKVSNSNIISQKPKYYFALKDGKNENEVIKFHETTSFFGLSHKVTGSPFHTIDYSNKTFNSGKMCLGCHDHKQNSKGTTICTMDLKSSKESKENCITCHMPQVQGSFNTIIKSKTHAYHGFLGVHNNPKALAKYIKIDAKKVDGKLQITVKNLANHKLFAQPLRLAQLHITIQSKDKSTKLKPFDFSTVLGKDGKVAPAWLATEILKDTTLKAFESRVIDTNYTVKSPQKVILEFGYYKVAPKFASKLGINSKDATAFHTLIKKEYNF